MFHRGERVTKIVDNSRIVTHMGTSVAFFTYRIFERHLQDRVR
jgi:hypothetical protein